MKWVFSYGLSTDPELMQADVGPCACTERAHLDGFAFRFTGCHPEHTGGMSTIVPMPGASVLGVAYLLGNGQVDALMTASQGYELRRQRLRLASGEVDGFTLRRAEVGDLEPPAPAYVARVRAGLCRHYQPELVDRYLDHATARSSRAVEVPCQVDTPDAYRREYGTAFRRLFPWEVTKSDAFGSAWAVLQPGEATTPHSHDERETFIILSGRGQMTIDGQQLSANRADAIYIEPFSAHTLVNNGTVPLELLCVWWDAVLPPGTDAAPGPDRDDVVHAEALLVEAAADPLAAHVG